MIEILSITERENMVGGENYIIATDIVEDRSGNFYSIEKHFNMAMLEYLDFYDIVELHNFDIGRLLKTELENHLIALSSAQKIGMTSKFYAFYNKEYIELNLEISQENQYLDLRQLSMRGMRQRIRMNRNLFTESRFADKVKNINIDSLVYAADYPYRVVTLTVDDKKYDFRVMGEYEW